MRDSNPKESTNKTEERVECDDENIVDFFRQRFPPGEELSIERDRSLPRDIEL
ncbi:MAG: hypothetical protein DHS20C10_02700 [marine bacterium B5-7]|nr:MAG: hypothetical protein DHS20C10_02700 [marine bacterium B5-7]